MLHSPFTAKSGTKKSMSGSEDDVLFNDIFTPTHPARKLYATKKNFDDSSILHRDRYATYSNGGDNTCLVEDRNFSQSLSNLTLLSDATTATPTTSTAAKFWNISRSFPNPFKSDKQKKTVKLSNQQTSSSDTSTNTFHLWSCANCMQINKVDSVSCGRCQIPCGSTAVGQCYCNVCKMKVFVPASTEMPVNTVCPCCEKVLLDMVAISS